MGARQQFEIPQGWVARGFRFEVEATTAEQQELINIVGSTKGDIVVAPGPKP